MSIAGSNDIDYIISKLAEIEEKLGGKKKQKKGDGGSDEFDNSKTQVLENIYEIRGKMNEMQKKKDVQKFRAADMARLRIEIQDQMKSTHDLIESLKRTLKAVQKNPKIPEFEKENKAKLVLKLENLYQDMRDEIQGKTVVDRDNPIEVNANQEKRDRRELFGPPNTGSRSRGDDFRTELGQLHEDEDHKLQEWKKFDEKLDNKLEDINVLLDQIKDQAEEQGQQMKNINELTRKADKELNKTTQMLDTQNNRLKVLLKKYRAPSRFCLDFIIFLLIIGMISIGINMIK